MGSQSFWGANVSKAGKAILDAKVELLVPYHDCDPAGVVWHGNYLRYFDEARCALLDSIDYGYREMEASGFLWPVIDAQLRFVRPLRYHEKFTVECRLLEYEYRMVMEYTVLNAAGEIATSGKTVQVAVDVSNNEMCLGSPQVLLDKLGIDADDV